MMDTGLLVPHAFKDSSTTSDNIYKAILFDKLEINEGMIMENAVAQALHTSKKDLYFYYKLSISIYQFYKNIFIKFIISIVL